MSVRKKWPLVVRAVIVLAFLGVSAVYVQRLLFAPTPAQQSVSGVEPTVDTTRSWEQVVLTYIGDPRCPVCSDSDFKESLTATIGELRQRAADVGTGFKAVGVALSGDFREGIEFLSESGEWDEVSLGGGWLNTHAQLLVWDRASRPLTPQMLVAFNTVSRSPAGDVMVEPRLPTIGFVGAAEIGTMNTETRRHYIFPLRGGRDAN